MVLRPRYRPDRTKDQLQRWSSWVRFSKATDLKICVLAKHEYLSSLRAAASSAAEPAVRDAAAKYEADADVQFTVTTQVSGFFAPMAPKLDHQVAFHMNELDHSVLW